MTKYRISALIQLASVFVCGAALALGQQQVNLTAAATAATMPDGTSVPMWGYSCGTAVSGSTATCNPLNPPSTGWSPVIITVPTGQSLAINLTNNLSFTPSGSSTANNIPTSLVIVGQLGGGLGGSAKYVVGPDHSAPQPTTWPIAGNTGGATFTPPKQPDRVQSFSTEVAVGTPTSLTWNNLSPGTYLLESGTHPSIQGPMGLYGIVVVTSAPANGSPGCAYPSATSGAACQVSYNAEIPLLFSEIDPQQNKAVDQAVRTSGFQENGVIVLRDKVSSVGLAVDANGNVINAGTGYKVGDTVTFSGGGGTGASAHVSGVDSTGAIQNITVDAAGQGYTSVPSATVSSQLGSGAQLVVALSLGGGLCSSGAGACYPPVVNYTPLYYLINGVAFDKTASTSLFAATPSGSAQNPVTGNVLVRFVNAGLRMHIPSIVGSQTGSANAGGFSLIAEDGNVLPGVPRVQNEVFMAAGKTYDVMINAPAAGGTALPVYDRQLSLSGNATARDAGMLAYIGINGGALPQTSAIAGAVARNDTYNSVIPGQMLSVSDVSKGVIANDTNVYGVQIKTPPTQGTVTLNANGTFKYVPCDAPSATTPCTAWSGSDQFTYSANGNTSIYAVVTLSSASLESSAGITVKDITYTSNLATYLNIKSPGVLSVDSDAQGYPLTVVNVNAPGLTLNMDKNGGFTASVPSAGTYTFTYQAQNSQGVKSAKTATVTLIFPAARGLNVKVLDGADKTTQITDYRWIIEEDRTFYVDPKNTTNTSTSSGSSALAFGTNFHTSYMPVIATGCTGSKSCESGQTLLGQPAVCDVGNGMCRTDASQQTAVDPSQVVTCTSSQVTNCLDPLKRYYISVLPGDAADPFNAGYTGTPNCAVSGHCGHGMGGAPIAAGQTSVTVISQPSPYPPAKLSIFVFEDDNPLNGEHDAGGGIDVLSPDEPGLGGFEITLQDFAGGTGDSTGQPDYNMFNMPLTNSLAGTIDPTTGVDACPIAQQATKDPNQKGIVGMIVTCPKYEADGKTLSPLAGQAIVDNLYPGRYGVVATPGADRIARGEEWLQTNTLDGQKAHDSFLRIGEPGYFQEFGPAGYHVTIGFANPKIINDRHTAMCQSTSADCTHEVKGHVTTARMSRTPDERLYGSGTHDSFAFTQCYASLGDPDGADFAFAKCNTDGSFDLTGLPPGNWKITIFDQWNDQVVDGISTAVGMCDPGSSPPTSCKAVVDMGEVAAHQWQANMNTHTFLDLNGNGVADKNEPGLPLVPTVVRFRDGSFSNFVATDFNGNAPFNEVFPLFNWYVVETDSTRYKNTGTHVAYDAGGPVDSTGAYAHMANTVEQIPLPANLHVPGAVYCNNADCSGQSIQDGPSLTSTPKTTGRIDPPWVTTEGWQGFSGQNNFLEFGKKPFAVGETGGIRGHVVYASTRPFDDPYFNTQNSWEPLVPHVTINLYQEGFASDGVTPTLKLVDTTQTSSFDDWAQGFRSDGVPNMNCPGQSNDPTYDPFFYGLKGQPQYLDWYKSGGNPQTLPNDSQFKCYDGMHNWNQVQPAPYDGAYSFPSVTSIDPKTGKPTATNCSICVTNPDANDPYRYGGSTTGAWTPGQGTPMLPAGKYVVEVVVPQGFEIVKEEDKNILIGDNYIAPVTQQFPGLGSNVFILPDQAAVAAAYNANNPQNPTNNFSMTPSGNGVDAPKTQEQVWPCVGQERTVPDFISLFPQSNEVAPFAGATRHLCDRKEVTLGDQMSAQVKFYVFTPTHIASHFTGVITDDFTAEFDPFSPQFGEKFGPAYMPVSVKDWAGNEISRVYADQFGAYTGLNYSTWEVNPPNPTGYSPTMMVMCMNDAGPIPGPNGQMITDPLYQSGYSQFCYELPFMPGQTGYFDTPVVPTSAFQGGYNTADCSYPDTTPAIKEVDGDGVGPWVQKAGNTLTITALGDQLVDNYGYSGPQATAAPFNQQKITRHYNFGTQCTSPTAGNSTCNTVSSVTIGGKTASIQSWSPTQIVVTVPSGVPDCPVPQQPVYGGSSAQCGQLVITAGNGKQSIDTVTVTIGGKTPTHVPASSTIQSAIDAAQPGDLIIVDPTCNTANGTGSCDGSNGKVTSQTSSAHREMVLMWKPVRLQGVGAASSVIDANPHPAGKLDPWRRQVVCLFGLALNGTPISSTNAYDSSNTFTCTPGMQFSVDRLPLEATVGWDATLNGNLAEQLIEPTIMGAYEGAGITVLGKGVKFPAGSNPFASDVFPTGTQLLTSNDCGSGTNPYPSNFWCNPSSIDGLSITNSSQGGGGILVHGWAHNLQIANNRVQNNQGTLSGGITIGQGEHPDVYTAGGAATNTPPGSCVLNTTGLPANLALPYCFDMDVNVHNNAVTQNSSLGDELFSSTPAGAGGVSFCSGSDYYKFNYNWVCGNLSTGDGAGVSHMGFSYDGDIEHNSILFNQSTNPTITTNGGGLLIMGAPDADPPCGLTTDKDCVSAPGSISPSDGTGPGLVINANLIVGNSADSGSGGGLRLQHVNGTDVLNFPNGNQLTPWPGNQPEFQRTTPWNSVLVTNNIIANNVAGWDGGGVSLLDALNVNIINNTIVSNNSTASSGVLFGSLFAPLASAPSGNGNGNSNCTDSTGAFSCPQPAGLVSVTNSAVLTANIGQLPAGTSVTCPAGHGANGSCTKYSVPLLYNDVFWQNRSLIVGVSSPAATGTTNQQNTVTMLNAFNKLPAAKQTATGGCGDANASYWDIGVRGDTSPSAHSGGTLSPVYSFLTDVTNYSGANNSQVNPSLTNQYCNGSRVPPENGGPGWQVPPGTNESNALPYAVFTLSPSATVDEGNNWINLRWGPLSLVNPQSLAPLFNPTPTTNSPVVDYIKSSALIAYSLAPSTDYFGNQRKTDNAVDAGAIELPPPPPPTLSTISPTQGTRGTTVPVTLTGTNLTGGTVNVSGGGINVTNVVINSAGTQITANFVIASNAATTSRNVTVATAGGTSNNVSFIVTLPPPPALSSISPSSGTRGTTVPVTLTGTNLTGGTVNVSGGGINVTNVVVNPTGTQITANFVIGSGAATGSRNVTVTAAGQTSNNVSFQVNLPPAPTLSSISPTQGTRGTTVPVTLTGTNLTGGTVNVSGGGINVTNVVVNSAGTQITANFVISSGAATGSRNVTVTAAGQTSNNVSFQVNLPPTPTLSSISPTQGTRGTTVPVTLTGTNLTGGTVNVSGGGINVTNVVVNSAGTQITANFVISSSAATGSRNVTVTAAGGTSGAVSFTVQGPTLASIAPNPASRGVSNQVLTFTGTNLTGTSAVNGLTGSGVTLVPGSLTVVNSSTVTVRINVTLTASTSTRNVSLTTPIGTTGTVSFSVH
jgi:Bacterial Ig domain